MKVVGFMGSPRKSGNCDLLLEEVLKGVHARGAESERITLTSYKIKPCMEIYACRTTGRCVIDDDFEGILDTLLSADAIILASPIFFYNLPSHTKAFVDRCQALWCNKYLLKRPLPVQKKRKGYFISVGATKGERLFDGIRLTVKYFFDVFDASYAGEILIRGVDEKGAIVDHPSALRDAFTLGEKIVRDF